MRNLVIKSEIIDGTTTIREYKGMIIPYFDLQMLLMVVVFGLGLYSILWYNNKEKKNKNIKTTIFAVLLFTFLLYWYSLPETIFYNLLRI
jgi:hypothetical protein